MAFPFLQRGNLTEFARHLSLASDTPAIPLENLVTGIDNLRHDVFLSQKFSDIAQTHISKLIAKAGAVEDLATEMMVLAKRPPRAGAPTVPVNGPAKMADASEYRRTLTELHMAALNRAKTENNISLD